MYYCFLFIIVFDASYMLLPLHVLCPKKKKKILVYSQVSTDSVRFPMFTVRTLAENLLVCGLLSWSHRGTPQHYRSKWFNLGFFVLVCMVSHILKIL